ncbi:MAG: lactate utilization protein [archaeon]|nr:lactate utilization protein [archaeon]MCP8305568.1 lactate utilization protein [archaeon]
MIEKTANSIRDRGVKVIVVDSRREAFEKILEIVPKDTEISNGSSTTLHEIGFMDYLESGRHGWRNLHEEIIKEDDKEKRADLRRKSVTAEYFLGSVNAIAQTGELVACDASGSRVTAYPYAAKNLILVAGAQKIAPTLEDAMKRVREYVYPLEDKRALKAYGVHSTIGKWVIIERERNLGRITLILVKEKLGF